MGRLKEWFTFKGRISRKTFIIRVAIMYLISYIIPNIPLLFMEIPESLKNIDFDEFKNGKIPFDVLDNLPTEAYLLGAVMGVLYLVFTIFFYATVNRRIHDIGHKSIWTLLLFILNNIFTNFLVIVATIDIVLLYLAVKKGNIGENAYGPDPLQLVGVSFSETSMEEQKVKENVVKQEEKNIAMPANEHIELDALQKEQEHITIEDLPKLKKMADDRTITQEEFEKAKRDILG